MSRHAAHSGTRFVLTLSDRSTGDGALDRVRVMRVEGLGRWPTSSEIRLLMDGRPSERGSTLRYVVDVRENVDED